MYSKQLFSLGELPVNLHLIDQFAGGKMHTVKVAVVCLYNNNSILVIGGSCLQLKKNRYEVRLEIWGASASILILVSTPLSYIQQRKNAAKSCLIHPPGMG